MRKYSKLYLLVDTFQKQGTLQLLLFKGLKTQTLWFIYLFYLTFTLDMLCLLQTLAIL